MFKIDEHVGVATSGLVADARQLVARARVESQINRITYADTVPIDVLVKKICDFKQSFTQYGGSRPFGTALLIGGVDEKESTSTRQTHRVRTNPITQVQLEATETPSSNTLRRMEEWNDAQRSHEDGARGSSLSQRYRTQRDAVEVVVVDGNGYRILDRGEVNKQLDRLKPLED